LRSPRSKVELDSVTARHYDFLLNALSLGYYPFLIRKVIDEMEIRTGQSILDLGSGTGRNDCLMARKTGPKGRILGLDISGEMLSLSRKRCRSYRSVHFREQRIETPLSYQQEFDKVFISFALHGFEDADKAEIISNAYRALKPGGVFCILDYNEFDLQMLWFPLRWIFVYGECELAVEFLELDLKGMLSSRGFGSFEEKFFVRKHLRLLQARK
jgi:demethylmenaquinone methyltransferase/2-methoxy-6-polyprenyl-1,4-benzoquinol methylase